MTHACVLARAIAAATCASLVGASVAPAHAQRAPVPARPDDPVAAADAHLKRGVELFAAHQYEAAIAEFEAGHGLDPRPDFLFALAQAERLSGDCASAVLYYREFLAGNPSQRQADAARANLERCEHVLSTSRASREAPREDQAPAAAPPAPVTEPEPEPQALAPAPPSPPPSPWYTDVLGDSLLAGGVVALGAGGFLWLRSNGSRDDALAAATYEDYTAAMDDARLERKLAIGAISVGGALGAAAVVRYLTRGSAEGEGQSVAIAPAQGGAVFAVGGRF